MDPAGFVDAGEDPAEAAQLGMPWKLVSKSLSRSPDVVAGTEHERS
jgi:hypothetical protein